MAITEARKQYLKEYYSKKKYVIRQQQRGYYIRNKQKIREKYLQTQKVRADYQKNYRNKEREIRNLIRQRAREGRIPWNPLTK